jgi:hypothetical protein
MSFYESRNTSHGSRITRFSVPNAGSFEVINERNKPPRPTLVGICSCSGIQAQKSSRNRLERDCQCTCPCDLVGWGPNCPKSYIFFTVDSQKFSNLMQKKMRLTPNWGSKHHRLHARLALRSWQQGEPGRCCGCRFHWKDSEGSITIITLVSIYIYPIEDSYTHIYSDLCPWPCSPYLARQTWSHSYISKSTNSPVILADTAWYRKFWRSRSLLSSFFYPWKKWVRKVEHDDLCHLTPA